MDMPKTCMSQIIGCLKGIIIEDINKRSIAMFYYIEATIMFFSCHHLSCDTILNSKGRINKNNL